MSNLGVVQSSAATVIGLQSPEMVQIQIQMLKNANEQREDTFTIGAEVTNDKNAATIEYGQQQARETRLNAEGSISGSIASTITLTGTTYNSISGQAKVDSMNKQLQNIGTFKENLGVEPPANVLINGQLDPGSLSPPATPKSELTFEKKFNDISKSLDERAELFNDQSEAKNAAYEFYGDTPEKEAAIKKARDDATALEAHLQRQVSILDGKINRTTRLGEAFSQSISGVIKGSFEMTAAETKVEQAQQQVLQNMADNSKSFVETMQSAMDQLVQTSLKGIEELQQNLQSVVQASNSRA